MVLQFPYEGTGAINTENNFFLGIDSCSFSTDAYVNLAVLITLIPTK